MQFLLVKYCNFTVKHHSRALSVQTHGYTLVFRMLGEHPPISWFLMPFAWHRHRSPPQGAAGNHSVTRVICWQFVHMYNLREGTNEHYGKRCFLRVTASRQPGPLEIMSWHPLMVVSLSPLVPPGLLFAETRQKEKKPLG